MRNLPPHQLPAYMLGRGQMTFTALEAQGLMGGSQEATQRALARLRDRELVFSPARGFWVVIPETYRAWGAVPPASFIGPMMAFLRREYYVALLSAAAIHNAHEPTPERLQVICAPSLRDRSFARVELSFMARRYLNSSAAVTHGDPPMLVATREMTALDLVERPAACGGLVNVGKVLKALVGLDGEVLATLTRERGRTVTRRAGWMIEQFASCEDLDDMRGAAEPRVGGATLLEPQGGREGDVDRSWGVRVNFDPRQ